MFWTIIVVLAVLWVLGVATSTTLGGLIHILLVVMIVAVAVNLLRGRSII